MKHRLNTRGCGLVTHISIERVDAEGGWADTDGATLQLWNAAEAGDLQSVRQILAQLDEAGLLERGPAGNAGPVNKQGPVSQSPFGVATLTHQAAETTPLCALICLEPRTGLDTLVLQVSGSTALHLAARWGHVDVRTPHNTTANSPISSYCVILRISETSSQTDSLMLNRNPPSALSCPRIPGALH